MEDHKPACIRRLDCRLCNSRDLTLVLSLAHTPPANAFVRASQRTKRQQTFPLDVFLCEACGHLQLLDVLDPITLFQDYVYVSGTSSTFVSHFEGYAEHIIRGYQLAGRSLVVDIGSNDGTLLRFFKNAGMRVLGVDPALEIAHKATESGIHTLATFFTSDVARRLRCDYGPARVITANNVFAHIDDLADIVVGVKTLLDTDGVFAFEVSYLVDVYEKLLFDTIYHEHLAYHSVKPLVNFFRVNGMELIDIQRVETHGGSIRGIVQHSDGPYHIGQSVASAISYEENLHLAKAETFLSFAKRIEDLGNDLLTHLQSLKRQGKSIAGYGAPAKATTLMHHFGIGPQLIDFIVDDSPLKQGLFLPGIHIPILPGSAVSEYRPDYLLILAWNFAQPIMEKCASYHRNGGRFIVPLPKLEVY